MNKTEKTTIFKQAIVATKKKFSAINFSLSIFAVFVIISLMLAYVLPESLILTVPLLIMPGFFSLTANNVILEKENDVKIKVFFRMFKQYFSPLFIGGYKLGSTFLLSLAAYGSVALVGSTIGDFFLISTPEYIDFYNSFLESQNFNDVLSFVENSLSSNSNIQTIWYIVSFLSLTAGVYFFIHRVCVHNIKYIHSFMSTITYPVRGINLIHKDVYRNIKKPFKKDYFKCTWFLSFIYFAVCLGSGTLCYFFFSSFSVEQAFIVSLLVTFIFLLFFIPLYLNVIQFIYLKYSQNYKEGFIKISLESLKQFNKDNQLKPEEEQKIMDLINSQKTNPDDDKKDDNK